jgi:hypothetical protein
VVEIRYNVQLSWPGRDGTTPAGGEGRLRILLEVVVDFKLFT